MTKDHKKNRLKKDESDDFINSPLGQYVLSFANSNVTLEQVQKERPVKSWILGIGRIQ